MKLKIPLLLLRAALVLVPVFVTGASSIRSRVQIFIPADNSVDSSKIVDGSIVTDDLADGIVTRAKLGQNAVGAFQIGEDSVTAAELGPGACDSTAIAAGAIYYAHLGLDMDRSQIRKRLHRLGQNLRRCRRPAR